MADEAAIQALLISTRGAIQNAAWTEYRENNPNPDLTQADLSNLELMEFDFRGCNLSGAKLFNCDLAGADLSGTNLTYTDMRRSNLANAFLTRAQASGVDLSGANLVDTTMDEADLRGARLGGSHLVGASLQGADLRSSNMMGANLKFTNLNGAHLEGANVEDAMLINVDIPADVLKTLKNIDKAIISGGSAEEAAPNSGGSGLKPFEDYSDLFLEADSYRILGVEESADLDEITKAYRKRAKEYHPDRVHNLGEKIRHVAQREFERVQHAYTSLSQHKAKPAEAMGDETTSSVQGAPQKDPGSYTLQDYINLAKNNPNNPTVMYNLGVFFFRDRMYEDALSAYQRCLALEPGNRSAQYNARLAAMMISLIQK